MRKLPTGELCAGEPHAQFGGRGGRESFPTPIAEAKEEERRQIGLVRARAARQGDTGASPAPGA